MENQTSIVLPWTGQQEITVREKLAIGITILLSIWLLLAAMLAVIDPKVGLLDIGTLTVLIFGLILGWLAVYISFWLQEILWKPFKLFRQQFDYHFNQLSSWQQVILYFTVFFLLLYAILYGLEIIL